MTIPQLVLVVARARNGVIGRDGDLPWRLRSDLQRFKAITLGKPCIMGRKTWESLPLKPLPGRLNLVLSRDESFTARGAVVCTTLDEAVEIANDVNYGLAAGVWTENLRRAVRMADRLRCRRRRSSQARWTTSLQRLLDDTVPRWRPPRGRGLDVQPVAVHAMAWGS